MNNEFEHLNDEEIGAQEQQLKFGNGYDHNFILGGRGYRLAGAFTGDKSGVTIEMYTDLPGVQLYIPGGAPNEKRKCKEFITVWKCF